MSIQHWEWMFVDDADVEEVGEAERGLAERRDIQPNQTAASTD